MTNPTKKVSEKALRAAEETAPPIYQRPQDTYTGLWWFEGQGFNTLHNANNARRSRVDSNAAIIQSAIDASTRQHDEASGDGEWYCRNCGYLSAGRVTNAETCDNCHKPVEWHDFNQITAYEAMRKALPPSDKLRLLADVFDRVDAGTDRSREVQTDLRSWADKIDAALSLTAK